MKKTIFIIITVVTVVMALVIGISVGGCQQKPGKPEQFEKVSIGISNQSLLSSLVIIAKEKDYFLEEGIDVELRGYVAGKFALEGLFKDEIDVSTVADMPIVTNSFDRNDFAIFGTILDSAQHAKVLTRKDKAINSPQDLIGKKIATTTGTTTHFFMVTFFAMNNLDLESVEIFDTKPAETVKMLINGEVDAIFTWEPNVLNAQKILGDNALLLPSDVGHDATFNLVSKKDFIENNQEQIKKLLRALGKAEEFVKDNREESVDIIASRLETDREDIDKLWDGYRFKISLPQSLIITLEDVARWSMRNNFTDKTEIPNYLDYVYLDALEEVKPEAVGIIH